MKRRSRAMTAPRSDDELENWRLSNAGLIERHSAAPHPEWSPSRPTTDAFVAFIDMQNRYLAALSRLRDAVETLEAISQSNAYPARVDAAACLARIGKVPE